MIISIIFAILGAVMLFFGARILITGKLGKYEDAKIAKYSKKGARVYRLMNVFLYMVVGVFMIAEAVIDFLQFQNILQNTLTLKIVLFAIVLVVIVVYLVVASKCKNMTDDEQ